mmetsp:Transcript_21810/g.50314  ORF Transcript_21810/g.50314 Transcript_21810/m.50314 type:complete len:154 (-) Transcript_21810:1099-1560(-)
MGGSGAFPRRERVECVPESGCRQIPGALPLGDSRCRSAGAILQSPHGLGGSRNEKSLATRRGSTRTRRRHEADKDGKLLYEVRGRYSIRKRPVEATPQCLVSDSAIQQKMRREKNPPSVVCVSLSQALDSASATSSASVIFSDLSASVILNAR